LGLGATDKEIEEMILQKTQAFKTSEASPGMPNMNPEDGKFDGVKYENFMQQVMSPNGYTKGSLEDFARAAVQMEKLKAMLGTSIAPTPAEVRSIYEEL